MTGKTHLVGGVLTGVCVSAAMGVSDPANLIALATIGGVGGLFPDIDIPTSKMGSTVKPVSTVVSMTAGHRGMFHAPLLYVGLCLLAASYVGPEYDGFVYSFFGGCMSHLILDAMNVQGIPVMWPFKSKLSLMRVKQGGVTEHVIRALLLAAAIIVTFRNELNPIFSDAIAYINNGVMR